MVRKYKITCKISLHYVSLYETRLVYIIQVYTIPFYIIQINTISDKTDRTEKLINFLKFIEKKF